MKKHFRKNIFDCYRKLLRGDLKEGHKQGGGLEQEGFCVAFDLLIE